MRLFRGIVGIVRLTKTKKRKEYLKNLIPKERKSERQDKIEGWFCDAFLCDLMVAY